MASHYWIKLYQDILSDPKMGRLSDSAWRRCIELFLLAGEHEERDGNLPSMGDIAWQLRLTDEQLNKDIDELAAVGIITRIDERHVFVTKFSDRQQAISSTERWRQWRDRQRQKEYGTTPDKPKTNKGQTKPNGSQTKRLTDIDIDKEKNRIDSAVNGEHTYIPPQEYPSPADEGRFIEIRTALIQQVKETLWFETEDKFNEATTALIDMGATVEQVNGFGRWWKSNGWHKGKPALKGFMNDYGTYLDGVDLKDDGKPRKKTAEERMQEMLDAVVPIRSEDENG